MTASKCFHSVIRNKHSFIHRLLLYLKPAANGLLLVFTRIYVFIFRANSFAQMDDDYIKNIELNTIFYAIVCLPWLSGEIAFNTSIAAWGILVPGPKTAATPF